MRPSRWNSSPRFDSEGVCREQSEPRCPQRGDPKTTSRALRRREDAAALKCFSEKTPSACGNEKGFSSQQMARISRRVKPALRISSQRNCRWNEIPFSFLLLSGIHPASPGAPPRTATILWIYGRAIATPTLACSFAVAVRFGRWRVFRTPAFGGPLGARPGPLCRSETGLRAIRDSRGDIRLESPLGTAQAA